jgi:tripartite-type tricarboxylate transporter receptor subunit TctC
MALIPRYASLHSSAAFVLGPAPMITRRRFTTLALATAYVPTAWPALAQRWPVRPVRFVQGFGGAMDTVARIVGNHLSARWGQPVIVETRAGAGGNFAAESVARSAPDGHTLLLAGPAHVVNRHLYSSLPYDPIADFAPVTIVCTAPAVMAVPNSSRASSVAEFIAYAKSKGTNTTYASPGNGSIPHLAAELFKRLAGIEMVHVPYRGVAPAYNDLLTGRVDVMFTLISGLQQVQAGQLRGLAVASDTRLAAAPELPTFTEAGLAGFRVSTWWAFFLPAMTPPEIITRTHADTVAVLGDPAVKDRLERIGANVVGSTPADLLALVKFEMDRWGRIIKEANIRISD